MFLLLFLFYLFTYCVFMYIDGALLLLLPYCCCLLC